MVFFFKFSTVKTNIIHCR